MGNFSIRVVDEKGRPCRSVKVTVDFGIWNGQSSEYTDDNGWTTFDNSDGDLVTGEVFINHESKGDISTYSGETYSYVLD
jgi:hypothetical protein